MRSELDIDTAIERAAAGRFRAVITDRWNIGTAPNGGYLAMILGRAMARELADAGREHGDPLSLTTHFLSVARPGPAEVAVAIVRSGRGHSTLEARLIQRDEAQEEREVMRALGLFGDLGRATGPTDVKLAPPDVPPLEACLSGRPAGAAPRISERLDMHLAPGDASWLTGERSDDATLRGWVRLADGREPDALSLIFFADAFPPPAFNLRAVPLGWVPTLELTVHVRARPAPGRLRARFTTRVVSQGYLEEDGVLWDAEDRVVAMSRQLARAGRG